MSRPSSNRTPNERRLMDEFQRWLKVPDQEIEDDLHDDDDSKQLDDLVERLRHRPPETEFSVSSPAPASIEPWHERLLRGLLTFMASMLLFGLLAGGLALLGLPLLEDVTAEAACDTLVWYAYRRSLAYSLVAFSGGILGVSILVALPALAGREHRGLRHRMAVVATLVLAAAIASGEKERSLRARLGSLTNDMATIHGGWDPEATRRCMEPFETEEVQAW